MTGRSGGGRTGGRSLGGRTRLKSRRGRSNSSARWLERQLNDPYVKRAQLEGWRARAAFKLIELDERFDLLQGADRVVDLGAAPGSWSQVVLKRRPKTTVVGIDLLEIEPLAGLNFVQGDFLADGMDDKLIELMGGQADLVMSDMAANTVGHPPTDHLRTMALVEAAADFAVRVLRPGGTFVAKVLGGGAEGPLVAELKRRFESVRHAKPPASRKESSETYLVAMGRKTDAQG
ncbi:RlmE family RNA methyltransferase [Sandaracinobacter neustonicus]|uniref:Ribosomal RNA large subunit methyltransferase E n=1 Tax=Sandaracinobacter neustonicus TaxID=1715348 RepID=A0A501XDB4_9SPHN|nr:RlmE family RNA methyltransferase [Sandaracinobacter neustonicus]TPE58502.1 RlmE family RNA methyltransferase [Sandaracinobacter neustonicus]